jgi:hypothetical protein
MMTMESPMKNHPLGLAARYNDADCEEKGFQAVFPMLGLELDDVIYIAQQRALRVVTGEMDTTKPIPVPPLTKPQAERLVNLQACILDGIVIGWRGHQIMQRDVAYAPPTYSQAVDLIRGIVHDFPEEEAKAILRDVTNA